MKRRTFLKGLTAFLAAPLAVFGTKKVVSELRPVRFVNGKPYNGHLTDTDRWFMTDGKIFTGDVVTIKNGKITSMRNADLSTHKAIGVWDGNSVVTLKEI